MGKIRKKLAILVSISLIMNLAMGITNEKINGAILEKVMIELSESDKKQGIKVELYEEGMEQTIESYTDNQGIAEFFGIDTEKKYVIKINREGYEEYCKKEVVFQSDQYKVEDSLQWNGIFQNGKITKEDKSITVEADENYAIDKLLIGGNEVKDANGHTTFTYFLESLESDVEITVNFQLKTAIIKFGMIINGTIQDENGTEICLNDNGEVEQRIDYTKSYSFKPVADQFYRIKAVTVNDKSVEQEEDGYYTICDISEANYMVNVEFEKLKSKISFSMNENGKIFDINENEINNTYVYAEYGTEYKFNIVENDDFYVKGVTISDGTETVNLEKDEYGYYKISRISEENYTVNINFEEVEIADETSILVLGAREPVYIKNLEEGGKKVCTYIYDNKMSGIEIKPVVFSGISYYIPIFGHIKTEYITVNETSTVENIRVYHEDRAFDTKMSIKIIIDKEAPEVDMPETVWCNSKGQLVKDGSIISGISTDNEIVLKGTACDMGESGISAIYYSTNAAAYEEFYNRGSLTDIITDKYTYSIKEHDAVIDGKSMESGTWTLKIPRPEQNTVYYVWACDRSGNISEKKKILINVDGEAPYFAGIEPEEAVSKDGITISGSITEGNSGISKIRYATSYEKAKEDELDNDFIKNSVSGEITKLNNNQFSVRIGENESISFDRIYYFWCYDNAGNKSDIKEVHVIIDRDKPVIDKPEVSGGWYNSSGQLIIENSNSILNSGNIHINTDGKVVIGGTVSDAGYGGISGGKVLLSVNEEDFNHYINEETVSSRLQEFEINSENEIDRQGRQNGRWSAELSVEGSNKYYVWVCDKAGNVSDIYISFEIKVDKKAPQITKLNYDENIISNENITIIVEAADMEETSSDMVQFVSGMAEVRYSTDEKAAKQDKYTDNVDNQMVYRANGKNGTCSIKVETEDGISMEKTYYIWAYDQAGNKSEIVSRHVILDKTPPELKELVVQLYGETYNQWSSDKTEIIAEYTDEGGSMYCNIYYDTVENYQAGSQGIKIEKNQENKYIVIFDREQNQQYVFWAVDEAGNKSRENEKRNICNIQIDKTQPKVVDLKIKQFDLGITPLNYRINKQPFGLFYNDTILVEAEVEDGVIINDKPVSSGIKEVCLLYGENGRIEPYEIISGEENHSAVARFRVSPYFKGTLMVQATDYVNRQTEVYLNDRNTIGMEGVNNDLVHLETEKPVVDVSISGDNEHGAWYSGDISFNIMYSDNESERQSGLNFVGAVIKITDNKGNVITEDVICENLSSQNQTWKFIKDVSTASLVSNPDGKYELTVRARDNAGNEAQEKIYVVNKDTRAPEIMEFDFQTSGYKEKDGSVLKRQEGDYGFYFMNDVKVVITAVDEGHASGVQSITYYTKSETGEESEKKTISVNENNQIVIFIPNDFKGQIYAKATDNVNNTSDYFVTPYGVIAESKEKHNQEEHITFTKPASTAKDAEGIDLYKDNTDVLITVSDRYSGIRKIEWSITAPYDRTNNQSGMIEIENDRTYATGSDTDWIQIKSDRNLVTEMSKTIKVKHNSNHITLMVKFTDRAGNVTERSMILSIDKTMPVYTITYDNNNPDSMYTNIYNADRTATIVVTERNFDNKNFIAEISNTYGVMPEISDWTTYTDDVNPDNSKHIATIRYYADGDYEFRMSITDMAGNYAPLFVGQSFTIDKTLPVLTVLYENNDVENGNYYKAERRAVITIHEHNFDASRVQIVGTAVNEGNPIGFPELLAWQSDGDIHTAVINYTADGFYTFDIDYTDMAGNKAGDYIADEFFIDRTVPVLEITGVEDKSANKGEVAPVITFGDTNYKPDNTVITLTGVNSGTKELHGRFENTSNGQIFRFDNIEGIQSNDDIYTLTAYTKDMAGNESSKSITFSVNRFGSVYTIDSKVQAISKKFVKSTNDIIFIETNVDNLDMEKIKVRLTKNGKPIDLILGRDFTIEQSGGNGRWCQYRYCISKKLFEDDGTYIITVYSVDAAGNINENDAESKKAEISFGVDNTEPIIIPIDIENGKTYAVDKKNVSFNIKDNLMLSKVRILLNGEEASFIEEEETYSLEMLSLNKKQAIKVIAEDAAGNTHEIDIRNVLVSTSLFVRWYNNKMAVGLTVGSIVLFAGLITGIVIWKKRKKEARHNSNV